MSKSTPIPHLQGFRGVAILLIILFHLCPAICPNGFFGVDAFLVLSGYFLIGKQLKTNEHFAFLPFLQKKGLRLFPPMLAVCIAITLASAFLPEFEMKDILRQVRWALCGIPNMELAEATNDYFAADTRHMPLMHLWYMGCIIQSYLLFALLFVGWHLLRLQRRGKLISLGVIILLSLAVRHQSLIHTFGWGGSEYLASTYYLTTARLWEMAIGGCLMILPDTASRFPRAAALLSTLAGAGFCLISFIPLSDGTAYMGVAVLLSALLILCGERGWFAKLLSCRPLLYIGGISFSLYLVHWPIICCAENYLGIRLSPLSACGEMILMAAVGICLYHAAEKRPLKNLSVAGLYLGCWALCALLLQTGSYRSLISKTILDIETLPYNMMVADIDQPLYQNTEGLPIQWSRNDGEEPALIYHLGDPSKEASFVLLGDSHSENLVAGFDLVGQEKGWSGVYLNSYFHPFWGALYEEAGQPKHTFDRAKGEAFLRWFKAHPTITHVVIAQYWEPRMGNHRKWDGTPVGEDTEQAVQWRYNELKELCDLLAAQGKRVILLADNPHIKGKNPRQYVLRKRLKGIDDFTDADFVCTKNAYDEQNTRFMRCAEQLEREGRCTLIRMGDALLKDGPFTCMRGNKLLMKDSHHLSYLGGWEAVKLIAEDFRNALLQQ